jgi:hypothetical protein
MCIGRSYDNHRINRRVLDRFQAIGHCKLSTGHEAATLGSFLHQISYCYYPDTTDRSQVAEVGLAHTAHAQKGHPIVSFLIMLVVPNSPLPITVGESLSLNL